MSDPAQQIREALEQALNPVSLTMNDDSWKHAGHTGTRERGGGHFSVHIVATCFTGKSRLARHRMVNEALGDAFKTVIHALSIRAQTPEEFSRETNQA